MFSSPAQAARWRELELDTLAALEPQGPVLLTAVQTVPVELLRSRLAAAKPSSPVVLAIPYQSLVPAADYMAYVDAYVIPQFEGWMREGVLSQFGVYASSNEAAPAWSHLILLDYRDDEAFAARAAIVAKVRSQLKEQPAWRAISENKAHVREERQAVLTDDISAGEAAR
jgi:hypothetical protein